MEKKAEKKELKIVLGVLLTVAVLAVIVAVIVIAVRSAAPQSRFLRGTYDLVDSELYDGVFVAAKDGEYMLVDEDNEISKHYAFIRRNPETGMYDFLSTDGFAGELGRDGKERYRRRATGNELSLKNRTTEPFYYTVENGVQTVRFGERTLVLASGERARSYEEAEYPDVPLGTVFYTDAAGTEMLTNLSGAPRFRLSDCVIHGSNRFVTVMENGSDRTYRLTDFSQVAFLDGADSGEILTTPDGIPVRYGYDAASGAHSVLFTNGDATVSYEIEDMPSKAAAVSGAEILIDFGAGRSGLYGPMGQTKIGAYQKLTSELFILDGKLYDIRNLRAVSPNLTVTAAEEAKALRADGVRYVLINGSLYTYTDGALTLRLGVSGDVTYQSFAGKLYFISGGVLYNNQLKPVTFKPAVGSSAEFMRDGSGKKLDNIVKKGNTVYADFAGNAVENVRAVYVVYDFSQRLIPGEYLFETYAGSFRNFSGEVMAAGFGAVSRVYKAGTGGYMIRTERGYGAGGTFLPTPPTSGFSSLFGESGFVTYAGAKLDTYQLTARSEFSLTETRYYSNIQITCSENGITFSDPNALYGFYSKEGKMISGPKYTDVLLTENFVLAEMPNQQTRLMDHSGRKLLADQQIDQRLEEGDYGTEYRGFMIVYTVDGKTKMIEADGTVVSEYARHGGAMKSFVTDTADIEYVGEERTEAEDSAFTYERFILEDGIRILKVAKKASESWETASY